MAAAFFALVWFGNAFVLLFVALAVGALALHEYAELMRQLGAAIPRVPTVFATLAVIAIVPFPSVAPVGVMSLGVVLIAIGTLLGAARLKPGSAAHEPLPGATARKPLPGGVGQDVVPDVVPGPVVQESAAGFSRAGASPLFGALTGGFALLYIGVPLGALVSIHIVGGRSAIVLLVATIIVSDSAQYYTGRAFGRRPLAPRLSPKKTIEGALGGFVAAPLFLYFAGPYLVPVATPLMVAPLGFILVACGIAGDLFESMMKRAAAVKDSAALIPGHGGILDRIDALLFATPPFYLFVRWVYTA